MIGTMDLCVAVLTLLAQYPLVGPTRRNACSAVGVAGMDRGRMTLLAQPGLPGGQQVFIVGTVWGMAVAAILANRRMFPQQGTTLFRMALIAGFVDRAARQQGRPAAAVRFVAIGAGQEPGVRHRRAGRLHRVARLAQELGALFLMALETDLRLCFQRQYRVIRLVHSVAIDTGYTLDIMCAARPMEACAILMTTHADGILVFMGCIAAEGHRGQYAGTILLLSHMFLRRPVTGFTVMIALAER